MVATVNDFLPRIIIGKSQSYNNNIFNSFYDKMNFSVTFSRTIYFVVHRLNK